MLPSKIAIVILTTFVVVNVIIIIILAVDAAKDDDAAANGTPIEPTLPPPGINTLRYGETVQFAKVNPKTGEKLDTYAIQICNAMPIEIPGEVPLHCGGCNVVNALLQEYTDISQCTRDQSADWVVEHIEPDKVDSTKGSPVQWRQGVRLRHSTSQTEYMQECLNPLDCRFFVTDPPNPITEKKGCCGTDGMLAKGVVRKPYKKDNALDFIWYCQPDLGFSIEGAIFGGFTPQNKAYISSNDIVCIMNASSNKYLTLCGPSGGTTNQSCWGVGENVLPFKNSVNTRDVVCGELSSMAKSVEYFLTEEHAPYWKIERTPVSK